MGVPTGASPSRSPSPLFAVLVRSGTKGLRRLGWGKYENRQSEAIHTTYGFLFSVVHYM